MTAPSDDHRPAVRHLQFDGLQYWRGIAALVVVYFHAVIQVRNLYGSNMWLLGQSGVDVFFVLSGFVMWVSTAGRPASPARFMLRRVSRIVPLYWGVTLAAALAALTVPGLLRSTTFDLPHVAASLAFIPWPNPAAVINGSREFITPLIVPGWTLNFEMLFYVLFALALFAPMRWRLASVTILVLLTLLVSKALEHRATAFEFYANDMLLEFLAGVWIAFGVTRWGTGKARNIGLLLAIIVVAFIVLLVADYARPPIPRAVALGIPAAILIAATARLELGRRIPRLPLLTAIGNASYSIYLTHIFVIAGMRMVLSAIGEIRGPGVDILFVAVAFILSTLVGWAVYRWIELPSVGVAKRILRV